MQNGSRKATQNELEQKQKEDVSSDDEAHKKEAMVRVLAAAANYQTNAQADSDHYYGDEGDAFEMNGDDDEGDLFEGLSAMLGGGADYENDESEVEIENDVQHALQYDDHDHMVYGNQAQGTPEWKRNASSRKRKRTSRSSCGSKRDDSPAHVPFKHATNCYNRCKSCHDKTNMMCSGCNRHLHVDMPGRGNTAGVGTTVFHCPKMPTKSRQNQKLRRSV